jgi:hypothetical protein
MRPVTSENLRPKGNFGANLRFGSRVSGSDLKVLLCLMVFWDIPFTASAWQK